MEFYHWRWSNLASHMNLLITWHQKNFISLLAIWRPSLLRSSSSPLLEPPFTFTGKTGIFSWIKQKSIGFKNVPPFPRLTGSREELSVGFARFQNSDSAGNVEIAIDASFEQALARPPLEHPSSSLQAESPFAEAPSIPDTSSDTCHGASSVKTAAPAAWKKFTRAFTNPLFGDPSAAGVRHHPL